MEWVWSYMAKSWNFNYSKQYTNHLVRRSVVSNSLFEICYIISVGISWVDRDHYFETGKQMIKYVECLRNAWEMSISFH